MRELVGEVRHSSVITLMSSIEAAASAEMDVHNWKTGLQLLKIKHSIFGVEEEFSLDTFCEVDETKLGAYLESVVQRRSDDNLFLVVNLYCFLWYNKWAKFRKILTSTFKKIEENK